MKLSAVVACGLAASGLFSWSVVHAHGPGPNPSKANASSLEVLRVETSDEAVIRALALEHGHLIVDRDKGVVIFDVPEGGRIGLLAKGLRVSVDPVLSEALNESQGILRAKGISGYACYRTVAESNARLDGLASAYPQLASVVDIGPSWEGLAGVVGGGERMRVLRLTNSALPGSKPALFAMTAVHAREYTTAELGLRFAEHLLQGYGSDAEATWLLDHHEIHLLVQSNPDGRKRAETGLLWRKNTNQGYCGTTSNSRGADLNRNFPFAWGTVAGGSSPSACSDTYRGPAPASEPETQAIVNYVRALYPDRRGDGLNDPAPDDTQGVFLDIHSYSQMVLWPWGITTQPAPNDAPLVALGRRFAWFNGYRPQQSVGLYPTDGTTDDFAYGELGVPAYTFELGTAFFQDCASFESRIAPDNLQALIYAARVARAPYRLPFGPEARELRVEPDLPILGEALQLTAVVDDSRSSNVDGSVAVQAISAARAYFGIPPWQAGAQPIAMQASDGSFTTSVESARVDLPSANAGRRLVYVQGEDASGALGPIGAAFVDIRTTEQVAQLAGRVSRIADSAAVAGAQVRVGGFLATADASGQYARRVPVEASVIEVEAAGYEPLRIEGLSLQPAAVNTRDLQLYAYCPRLSMDAEQGTQGWTATRPSGGTPLWSIVQTSPQVGSRAWHDSPAGNYVNNLDTQLTSPVFDLQGYTGARLRLRSFCDTESGYDFGVLQVRSAPSATWTTVYSCSGDPSWRSLDIPLPQIEGAAQAQIRFRLTSDGSEVDDGWFVDDLVIEAGGPSCRAQQQLTSLFDDGFEAP
jgi:hypothetical protein